MATDNNNTAPVNDQPKPVKVKPRRLTKKERRNNAWARITELHLEMQSKQKS